MPVANETETKIEYYITPVGRLSYVNAWKPRKKMPGEEGKADAYDCMLIMDMPKDMTADDKERYKALKQLMIDTADAKFPKFKGKLQCKFRTVKGYDDGRFFSKPLDGEKNPEYEGKLVLGAISYGRKPQVLRPNKEEMMEQSELYSGCYGRLWVTAFAYDNSGNKGVSFSLQGIMKTKDGTPLGGAGGKATAAFATIEVEEDDNFDTEDDEDLEGI